MKKIFTVELKETEIVQPEGSTDFVEVVKSKQTYPVYLTNYAMARGHDMGLLKSSLINDLIKMKSVVDAEGSQEEKVANFMEQIDEQHAINVIYLAFLGANPKTEIAKDQFLQQYQATFTEKITLYLNILSAAVDADPNAFADGLAKSTAKAGKDEKK